MMEVYNLGFAGAALEALSLVVNTAFALLAAWGLIAFYPKKHLQGDNPAGWLILAIWVGFLGVGLNVFYWRVFGDIVTRYGLVPEDAYVWYGSFVGDFIWKGLGALSIYLHFYARWKALPDDEKPDWSPLLMGFYPNMKHWAYRAVRFWKKRQLADGDDES